MSGGMGRLNNQARLGRFVQIFVFRGPSRKARPKVPAIGSRISSAYISAHCFIFASLSAILARAPTTTRYGGGDKRWRFRLAALVSAKAVLVAVMAMVPTVAVLVGGFGCGESNGADGGGFGWRFWCRQRRHQWVRQSAATSRNRRRQQQRLLRRRQQQTFAATAHATANAPTTTAANTNTVVVVAAVITTTTRVGYRRCHDGSNSAIRLGFPSFCPRLPG
jgi:hypothetical protein